MSPKTAHYRLLALPFGGSPAGGWLEALRQEPHGRRIDLLMDYHELQLAAPPALFERLGRPWEQVQGSYLPRRIRFVEAEIVKGAELCALLESLPADDPGRLLNAALAWRDLEGRNHYLFDLRRKQDDTLLLTARRCLPEQRTGPARPADFARDWSPPPPCPARLIPDPRRLRQRYGGDPVPVRVDGRLHQRRLFIGGLDTQGEQRPDVHAVLNLGEEASRWTAKTPPQPADRWDNQGEGSSGMNASVIAEEAGWVIERLQTGKRVLVHCSAGMNRSTTICCAVLILLEGITAEAALERVREQHPWARPDPRHWLALRWLARAPAAPPQ